MFTSFDSVDQFLQSQNHYLNDTNKLTIIGQNIRSLNRNLDNFLTLFPSDRMPDILVFSETWHDPNIPVSIPGYHTVRQGRAGGVSIFVKNCISSSQVMQLSYANETIEICSVEITNLSAKCTIFGIYRPHSDSIENFSFALENIINSNQSSSSPCVILGDFNADLFSDNININNFVDMMRSHHYMQIITGITHPGIIGTRPSLLDHIWINQATSYSCGILRTGVTDHHTTFLQLPFLIDKTSSKKIEIKYRDCNPSNQSKFVNNLNNFNWQYIQSDNVNTYTNNFLDSLNYIYCESFPLKKKWVTEKYYSNPWYTPEVHKLSLARNQYHSLLLENLVTHAQYAIYRNKVTTLLRKCKESYFQRCFERNSGNIKATWKTIRSMCGGVPSRVIDKLTCNNITLTNPSDIAETLNNFFVNIASDLAHILPPSEHSPYAFVNPNPSIPLFLDPVTPDECSAIISSLKPTTQNINNISVKIFQKYHHIFVNTLCSLINLSFSTAVFPNVFKHAIVIPIFKKGDREDASNYRPIALLHFISKIFERCIFNRLINYSVACNLLIPNQFGFTKGKSTQDAILRLSELIYESLNSDDGSFSLNVFVDFQKAFDTINLQILLGKLELYGIKGLALKLIKNYLSDRTQSVRIGDTVSSSRPILIGVPQGSILGPLLFLFFINDLPNISNTFTTILFADDTTLNFKFNNIDEANLICNVELQKFLDWTLANRLSINFGMNKTYCILHTYRNRTLRSDDLNIVLNNNELNYLNVGTFLGVKIDSKMKFSSHIDHVCTKVSKAIGIIYKLSTLKAPYCILKQVYYSIVYPYLNYNVCSYAATYSTYLDRILMLQKRLVRIINRASYFAHTDELFFNSGILKIQDIYKLCVGLYMYDHQHDAIFVRNHSYNTRNRSDLLPTRSRLTITQNSISASGPNIWNSIPNEIKSISSKQSFKFQYKKFLLSSYVQP